MDEEPPIVNYASPPVKRLLWVRMIGPTLAIIAGLLGGAGPIVAAFLFGDGGAVVTPIVLTIAAVCAIVALVGVRYWSADTVVMPSILALVFVGFWLVIYLTAKRYGSLGN